MKVDDHLKRCKNCREWTNGKLDHCTFCGAELDAEYKKEIQKRIDLGDPKVPLLQVHDHDPVWLKLVKRPIQVAQLIFYAIIAFLVYLTTTFAH